MSANLHDGLGAGTMTLVLGTDGVGVESLGETSVPVGGAGLGATSVVSGGLRLSPGLGLSAALADADAAAEHGSCSDDWPGVCSVPWINWSPLTVLKWTR